MKELSIEEKARAYDEVSKEVKDFFEGKQKMYNDVTQTLEHLFPELKESEDEKVRKEIICLIEGVYKGSITDNSKAERDRYVAWLEKQGKQKYVVIPKFRIGDIIRWKKADSVEYTIKEINDKGYINTADGIMDISQIDIEFELVEKKPEWCEEDKAILDTLIRRLSGEDIYISPRLAIKTLEKIK